MAPEKQEAAQQLLGAFDAFREEYGTAGVQKLLEAFHRKGTIVAEDIGAVMEEIPSREEFRTEVIDALIQDGCLRKQGKHLIVNIEAIRRMATEGFRKKHFAFSTKGKFAPYFEQSFAHGIFEALEGIEVISEDDWEKKRRDPHPLLYQPHEIGGPFDMDEICEDQSYLGLWEFAKNRPMPRNIPYPGQPAEETFANVSLAAIIYHPRYGNGYRDEKTDKLMVFDPKKGEHIPITTDWLIKTMGFQAKSMDDDASLMAPIEYLQQHGEELENNDLLRTKDFRQLTARAESKAPVSRMERTAVSSRGTVMLKGVMHYLGRAFTGADIRVVEISPGVGVIYQPNADGTERLTHTFTIVDRKAPGLKMWKSGKNEYGYAGAELTNVREAKKDAEITGERSDAVKHADAIRASTELLRRNGNIRFANLPPTLQGRLAESVLQIPPSAHSELATYGKQYGLDGLKVFIGTEDPSTAMELAHHLGPPLMRSVIARYNDVLKTIERSTEDLLQEIFTDPSQAHDVDRERIETELITRASVVLKNASAAIAESPKATAEHILKRLTAMEADVALFASVFKTAFKGKNRVPFEELKHVTLERATPSEISPDNADEMLEMAKENWPTHIYRNVKIGDLSKKLKSRTKDIEFSILKREGRILAFMHFDHLPDGQLYAGSLNVSMNARGSAIGEAFLGACLNEVGKDHDIRADFFPEVDAGMMYVDRLGGIITGTEDVEAEGRTVRRCVIRWNRELNDSLSSRAPTVTKEYLMAHAGQDAGPYYVERFRFPEDRRRFMDTIDVQKRAGRVGSRYFADPHDPKTRYVVFETEPVTTSIARRAA